MNRPRILLDTNILLRLPGLTVDGFLINLTSKFRPCICFQNLTEFWSVATRPTTANGFELSVVEASAQIKQFRDTFELIPEVPETLDLWAELCINHKVTGRWAHDIKLAATALSNGITEMLTNNVGDFNLITGLNIYTTNDLTKNPATGANQ